MPLGVSSLASVCRKFADVMRAGIAPAGTTPDVTVLIGTPAAAAPAAGENTHRLNLFFFRFEPGGFFPDTLPGEPWLVRMHCLITPFCSDENSVTAGDNDLRLIGEVMRMLHERPSFLLPVGTDTYFIQTIFCTLGLDQLNQLWSTQGDTIYRPSLLCEVSLAPVIPRDEALPAPLVNEVGLGVRADTDVRETPLAGTALAFRVPQLVRTRPDTRLESWAPALCLIDNGSCVRSIALRVGSDELQDFDPEAWVAGEAGAQVTLHWQTWDATTGWNPHVPVTPAAIVDQEIDPDAVAGANALPVELPFTTHAGQMLLVAHRQFVRASDSRSVEVRSDPVLVTLYEAVP